MLLAGRLGFNKWLVKYAVDICCDTYVDNAKIVVVCLNASCGIGEVKDFMQIIMSFQTHLFRM